MEIASADLSACWVETAVLWFSCVADSELILTTLRVQRQTLEIMLASLYLKARQYQDCLAVAQPLIKELKRLDDKLQLVEVQLMESRAHVKPPRRTQHWCSRTLMGSCAAFLQGGMERSFSM